MGKFIGEKSISYIFQVIRNYINEGLNKLSEINDSKYSLLSHTHTFPISNSTAINNLNQYALDAVEKNPSIPGTLANKLDSASTRLNNQIYTGYYVNNLTEFVESIIGTDQSVRFKAGNIKLLESFIPILELEGEINKTIWFQFYATWQNHYSNELYDICLRVTLIASTAESSSFNFKIYQLMIGGLNHEYKILDSVNLTPFRLGIDDKGNYGYYKHGSTTLTPF